MSHPTVRRPERSALLALSLLLALGTGAACAEAPTEPGGDESRGNPVTKIVPGTPAKQPEPGRPEARQAHEFVYEDINPASPSFGRKLALKELYQKQGVVLNFLASWCPPCWHEMPDLIRVSKEIATPVVCVAADEYGPPADLLRLAAQAELKLPIVLVPTDEIEEMESHYDHGMLPTTYWIGKDGTILDRRQGQLSAGDFFQVTRKVFPAATR